MSMKGLFSKTRESLKYVPSELSSDGSGKIEASNELTKQQSLGAMLK